MIIFDTTMFAYAAGTEHPLREPSRKAFEAVESGVLAASTTVEVIQEFAYVRARRRSRQDAAMVASRFARGLRPLLRPDLDDLIEGLDLFAHTPGLGSFDAVLAATARRRGHALASADHSFADVEALAYLDPGSDSFLDDLLLAG